MEYGFVKIYRKITDNWIWEDKPFSKGQAWIDLVMMANHKDNKFMLGSEVVTVDRGSFITSELKLMERWGWGKSKTRTFLKVLEEDGMILKKSTRKRTTITICNYSLYHDYQTTDKPLPNHSQTTAEPLPYTNKNVKNDKNEKNEKKKDSCARNPFLFFEEEMLGG